MTNSANIDVLTPHQGAAVPIGYVVAVLLGLSPEQIAQGLQNGSVAPPPGAPASWTPIIGMQPTAVSTIDPAHLLLPRREFWTVQSNRQTRQRYLPRPS